MPVVDGDILRATGSLTLGRGTISQSVKHFKYSGAGDTDDEVGDAIMAWYTSVYTNVEDSLDNLCLSTQLEVWLYDMVTHMFDGIYLEDWLTIIGTLAGYEIPNGVAGLIKMHTALPRRQARTFVAGLGGANYLDTGWNAAVIADLALMSADMYLTSATANGLVAAGTFNVDDESPLYETFAQFKNSSALNQYANYQRRRRPGVGI